MNDYEKLQAPETVSQEFKDKFERALGSALLKYKEGAMLVDKYEDNAMDCAFAKGFLAGCVYLSKEFENDTEREVDRGKNTCNDCKKCS